MGQDVGEVGGVGEVGDVGGEAPCLAARLDASLAISNALLARLVAELADAVVVADPEGRIVLWNAAATRIFGFTEDEAIGTTLDLIIPDRLRQRHWTGYERTMATGETSYGDRLLEVPALHRDGRQLSIAFTVTLLHEPELRVPIGIAAVIRDDTERWQERRRVRAELEELRGRVGGA